MGTEEVDGFEIEFLEVLSARSVMYCVWEAKESRCKNDSSFWLEQLGGL